MNTMSTGKLGRKGLIWLTLHIAFHPEGSQDKNSGRTWRQELMQTEAMEGAAYLLAPMACSFITPRAHQSRSNTAYNMLVSCHSVTCTAHTGQSSGSIFSVDVFLCQMTLVCTKLT